MSGSGGEDAMVSLWAIYSRLLFLFLLCVLSDEPENAFLLRVQASTALESSLFSLLLFFFSDKSGRAD